jgi:hypothetical protein
VDGTGSGSLRITSCDISCVERAFCYQTVSEVDVRDIGGEDRGWMVLAVDRVQARALVLAMLKLLVVLPECWLTL